MPDQLVGRLAEHVQGIQCARVRQHAGVWLAPTEQGRQWERRHRIRQQQPPRIDDQVLPLVRGEGHRHLLVDLDHQAVGEVGLRRQRVDELVAGDRAA